LEFSGFSTELLVILFFVSIAAGFIDTLAGGGGLITMPALLISGVPPLAALGTNKLQGSVGTATSTYMMIKHKRINWHEVKYLMILGFIGSALGSAAVQFIKAETLSFIIPIVLIFISVYFVISPKPHNEGTAPRLSEKLYRYSVVPAIGWYDGMFGPGTGSFFALAGVSLRGHSLINSTAVAKALNFSTNIASLIIFVAAGQFVWILGLTMMLGQMVGAWFGSHYLFKINPAYLRVIVVLISVGMLIKYLLS
jgi:hypothetical protein